MLPQPRVSKKKAVRFYGGEDSVYTIIESSAGECEGTYTVIEEDAHGETSIKASLDINTLSDLIFEITKEDIAEIIKTFEQWGN